MQNSASTIFALLVAGILLFIVPLVTLTDRSDNVTQEKVKLIVEEFVTEVKNTGKLTRAQYQNFIDELDATGNNTFTPEIKLGYLGENYGKKTAQTNYVKIGENSYCFEHTTQTLKRLGIKTDNEDVDTNNDTIILKKGDYIIVEVRNDNSTPAQTLKSSFIGFPNAGEYVISASSSGMVAVDGVKD